MAENADGTRLPVWWLVEKLRMEVDNGGEIELGLLTIGSQTYPLLQGSAHVCFTGKFSAVGFCQGLFGFVDLPIVQTKHRRIASSAGTERPGLFAFQKRNTDS